MVNRCNEWECPYNKNGVCTTNECPKMEELYNIINKESANRYCPKEED